MHRTIRPPFSTIAAPLLVLGAWTSPVLAQTTWTVGPGVGYDFNDIDDALAVAGPFDLVDVFPGMYPPFTMSSPARVIGRDGALVGGECRITGIPANRWALVADLAIDRLIVENTNGTVVLDGIETWLQASALVVRNAADVRVRELDATPFLAGNAFALSNALVWIDASRVQLDDCVVRGGRPAAEGDYGQRAIAVEGGSFVHVTGSEIEGGDGGDGVQLLVLIPPGDGAPAFDVSDDSSLRIVRSTIRGGGGGLDPDPPFFDGDHGPAIYQCGGTIDVWDSVLEGGMSFGSVVPQAPATVLDCGATLVDTIDLPAFQVVGTATAGGSVDMVTSAGVGASMRIIVGRFPVRVPVPGTIVPRLVDLGRVGSLGAIPGSGEIVLPTNVPGWPRGTILFVQTSRTNANGTDFSNGGHILLR